MILVYLALPVGAFSEFDAHYFPGSSTVITRLSEPKHYGARSEPTDRTVLCAELPCGPEDPWWTMDDDALGAQVARDLAAVGLPLPAPAVEVTTRRLKQAYPIYLTGYEAPLAALEDWVNTLPGLLSYGRQGLFAHDNTHHALAMAYGAVDCLQDGEFDWDAWNRYLDIFATHVVED